MSRMWLKRHVEHCISLLKAMWMLDLHHRYPLSFKILFRTFLWLLTGRMLENPGCVQQLMRL
uniref:Uncharacterized protein n=1 Tax=Arundo donax TaxID=35708 RepID=A0A0A9CVB7_ARUDO